MAWHGHARPRDKPATGKRRIEQYDHKGQQRKNNPPVGLVTEATDRDAPQARYAYDPHLDPQLVWAGKAEHTTSRCRRSPSTSTSGSTPRPSSRPCAAATARRRPIQGSLFESAEENPPLREAIDFYQHAHGWTNRLIAGDSLLVMNSLLEKEGMAGKVQMVYIDPPYGIRYGSNFQPFVNKRDVKDGSDEDLTQEPEMIRAFRDTWELGIHSYLTYLRDRLLLARELLHESGSCFVQISDENVHHVREADGRGVRRRELRRVDHLHEDDSGSAANSACNASATTSSGTRETCDSVKYRQLYRRRRRRMSRSAQVRSCRTAGRDSRAR